MAQISQIDAGGTAYNLRDDVHTWGGRNLLKNTIHPVANYWAFTRSSIDGEYIKLTPTTSAAYVKTKVSYLDYIDTINKTYTLTFEAKQSEETSSYTNAPNILIYPGYSAADRINSIFSSSYDRYKSAITLSTAVPTTWTKYSLTFTAQDSYFSTGKIDALTEGSQLSIEFGVSGSRIPLYIRRVKLECGNKATDWSPAPEDIGYVNGTELILLS